MVRGLNTECFTGPANNSLATIRVPALEARHSDR